MAGADEDIVDWRAFAHARAQLGVDFVRILGYFRTDGEKAVAAIEEAIRRSNAAAIVIPAHTLTGDAAQLGGTRLATLAEQIEFVARRCVESHDTPAELIPAIVGLRPLFRETIMLFDREAPAAPLRRGPAAFGRKPGFALR